MVDRLKESVDGLEPPTCPKCHIDMRWYRAELVSGRTSAAMIAHYFYCTNCGQRAELKTKAPNPDAPPPSKLSRSARLSQAA